MVDGHLVLKLTVVTSDGLQHIHEYPLSGNRINGPEVINQVMNYANDSMQDNMTPLYMANPAITYNKAYIARIHFEASGAMKENVEQHSMGFIKNNS